MSRPQGVDPMTRKAGTGTVRLRTELIAQLDDLRGAYGTYSQAVNLLLQIRKAHNACEPAVRNIASEGEL